MSNRKTTVRKCVELEGAMRMLKQISSVRSYALTVLKREHTRMMKRAEAEKAQKEDK